MSKPLTTRLAERGLALRKGAVGLAPEDGDDVVAETLDVRDRRVVGIAAARGPPTATMRAAIKAAAKTVRRDRRLTLFKSDVLDITTARSWQTS